MTTYETLLDTVRSHGVFHPLTINEATEDYLKRLAKAVSGVTKRLFDDMTEDAQMWFDSAATAMSEQMPIPVPEGFDRAAAKPMVTRPNATVVKIDPNRGTLGKTQEQLFERAHDSHAAIGELGAKPPAPRRPRPTGAVNQRPAPPPPPPPTPKAMPVIDYGDGPVSLKIHRMVIADPSLPVASMIRQLKENGVKVKDSTVKMTRYNTLTIIRLLREAGWQPPSPQ